MQAWEKEQLAWLFGMLDIETTGKLTLDEVQVLYSVVELEDYPSHDTFAGFAHEGSVSPEQFEMLVRHLGKEINASINDLYEACEGPRVASSKGQAESMRQGCQDAVQGTCQPRHGKLRFGLNDRVVCNIFTRWVAGHVVGTNEQENDDWCYLVRTDAHPGMEPNTIPVPEDTEFACVEEVCFRPGEMTIIKGAAPQVSASSSLRFAVGARVTCRVRHKGDLIENWESGTVVSSNVALSLPLELGGMHPTRVPYLVELDIGGTVLCHADSYTLIRGEGLAPQHPIKGISKRMEERREACGTMVIFDHMTEKKKVLEPQVPKHWRVVTPAHFLQFHSVHQAPCVCSSEVGAYDYGTIVTGTQQGDWVALDKGGYMLIEDGDDVFLDDIEHETIADIPAEEMPCERIGLTDEQRKALFIE